jgi:hypothetical protein
VKVFYETWYLPESCVSLVFKDDRYVVFRLLTLARLGFTSLDCFQNCRRLCFVYGQQPVSVLIDIFSRAPGTPASQFLTVFMFSYFVVAIQPGKH